MDKLTEEAIDHLLEIWDQYSFFYDSDGSTWLLHQFKPAGKDAAAFLERLGLGHDNGVGFIRNGTAMPSISLGAPRIMDNLTEQAIYHLLKVWGQYANRNGIATSGCYEHHYMSAGEDAGAFLERLGLGKLDYYLCLNEKGLALANDDSLNVD